MYVLGNQRDSVTIHCVPPGQLNRKDVQLYEWRTVDNKVIVNRPGKIHVDVNTGDLKIFNVEFSDSAQLFCSAVLASEDRITFTHNIIGKPFRQLACRR